jgi:hypothetical protein
MGISFKKKSAFHLSNGVFPIFCYEISATHWLEDFAWRVEPAWNA